MLWTARVTHTLGAIIDVVSLAVIGVIGVLADPIKKPSNPVVCL